MNHSTEERDGDAGFGPSNGEPSASRLSIHSFEWSGELDSVLMGRREAGRDELLERICNDQVRRWRRGQRVPAESYLSKYPALCNDDEAAFELIYGEYLLREEHGETPSPEELRWRFPKFAERLRRQVDLHQVLGSADESDGLGSAAARSAGEPDVGPEMDGPFVAPGFRILGELGRGGMGTVYKAWQVSLKRVVALKVLRAVAYADAGAAARFQAEAEAAARFQHPNIVQVYEVGEYEGMGFLVLEYAAGGGLDRQLAETLQDPCESARLLETLARAMHFAHERGIIHRDLKPANVLLAEDGIPKIADFGLAKLLEREDSMTREGEILGTPSYMAPEQVRGATDEITPATDVYSLGAILYETLTGRPPFKGTTPLSTLEQVSNQEPLSPGKLQRHLPRDLETICLKCLEKEPGRRYATAQELADDLDRFLHGRPILARPTPAWERLAKWCRRRPGGAAAVAALVLLSLLLLGGGFYYNLRLRQEMHAARKAEQEAAVDARAAFEQRNLALKTLDQLIYDVQERLAQTPATRSLRRSLLDTAIRGLQDIERSTAGGAPDISQAVAYEKLGDIYRVIGDSRAARQHYDRSLGIAVGLSPDTPNNPAFQEVVYQAHMGLGLVDLRDKLHEAAQIRFRNAVWMAESIALDRPRDTAARRDLIEAYLQLGRAHSFAGESADAGVWFRKMHDLADRWVREEPGQNQARDLLAAAFRKLGDLHKLFDTDFAAARQAYERAIDIGRALVEAEPESEPFKSNLATALDDLGGVAGKVGRTEEARRLFGEAERLFAELVARDPENLESRIHLLHTLYNAALLNLEEARYKEAGDALRRIRDDVRKLRRDGRVEGQPWSFSDEGRLDKQIEECEVGLRTSG
jgi:tetratricopeptide (TPR) repeat protein